MTDKPHNVRIARPEDEDAIFSLMFLAHKENGIGKMDPGKVWRHIRLATRQQGGVIGVIDGKDGPEACIFLILSQWWYSNEWHIEELKNFVHPDHRRTTHAKMLIDFAKWFSEQMSLSLPVEIPLFVGILTTHRVEAKVRLYQRRLQQGGAVFFHNVPDGYLNG